MVNMLSRGGHHHSPDNCHHNFPNNCHHHQSHCHHHQHRDHHNPPQANSWSPPRRTCPTSWTTSSFAPAHSRSIPTRVSAFVLEIRIDMMTNRIMRVMAMMTMKAVVILSLRLITTKIFILVNNDKSQLNAVTFHSLWASFKDKDEEKWVFTWPWQQQCYRS